MRYGKSKYSLNKNKMKITKQTIANMLGIFIVGMVLVLAISSIGFSKSLSDLEMTEKKYDSALQAKQANDRIFEDARVAKCHSTVNWANQGLLLHFTDTNVSPFTKDQVDAFLDIVRSWDCSPFKADPSKKKLPKQLLPKLKLGLGQL